jgi:hypothetical protein
MRHRHRCVWYQKSFPGWIRYGFSPGWVDKIIKELEDKK